MHNCGLCIPDQPNCSVYWSCGLVLEVDIESESSELIKRNITVCDVEVSFYLNYCGKIFS